jgi:hypothetical protein
MYLFKPNLLDALGATGGRVGARCCPDPAAFRGIGPWQPEGKPETGRRTDPVLSEVEGPGNAQF